MHDDLRQAIDDLFPSLRARLEDLIHIPSVSADGYDPAEVRRSAEATAHMLRGGGVQDVRLLEIDGAHPAVYGEIRGPEGSSTVLLYAHHDVQPPGPSGEWTHAPFEPVEVDGRLFGRGSSDDKCGILVHLGAIEAHGSRPPVGVKFFIEGEEEIGSDHLEQFIARYGDLLACDVIVIADLANVETGTPSLTVSLRGLVDCEVEVRTLEHAVHSGLAGGSVPDALTALSRLISTLHDDEGNVAVEGLRQGHSDQVMPAEFWRDSFGVRPGVDLIGNDTIESRIWAKPSISVLAIDAPPVAEAINQLVPVARAKISMRLPPGQDAEQAMDALVAHAEGNAPWGVEVTVTKGAVGEAFRLDTSGTAYDAFREAFAEAWGVETVEIGQGGSIPFVSAFSNQFPEAQILLTGVGDHMSHAHAPDESLDLDELRNGILAEAIALRLLGAGG